MDQIIDFKKYFVELTYELIKISSSVLSFVCFIALVPFLFFDNLSSDIQSSLTHISMTSSITSP